MQYILNILIESISLKWNSLQINQRHELTINFFPSLNMLIMLRTIIENYQSRRWRLSRNFINRRELMHYFFFYLVGKSDSIPMITWKTLRRHHHHPAIGISSTNKTTSDSNDKYLDGQKLNMFSNYLDI